MPKARITINNGTGFLTFGIFTIIFPFVRVGWGETIRTDKVRTGLEVFSETERISAECEYNSFTLSLIYKVFGANFSCVKMTFSLPSTIKCPPGSFLHSPI